MAKSVRNTIVLSLALLLVVASFGSAFAEDAPITQGIFEINWTPEGYSELRNYFHFYENGVFYLSAYSGQTLVAGFYEVIEEPFEYNTAAEDAPIMATAAKYVKLLNPDGSLYADMAWDNDTLWNLPSLFYRDFPHVPDSAHTNADEIGVTIQEYVDPDDEYSTILIKHNGEYEDTIDSYIEGVWSVDGGVYTLTDSDSGESYTLALSEDGNTALYTGLEGEQKTLANKNATGSPVIELIGSAPGAYGTLDVTVTCFDNGKCAMLMKYAGTENKQEGVWSMEGATLKFSLGDTAYEAKLNMTDMTFGIEFSVSDGTADVSVPLASQPVQ